jgi:hypothetical protein
MIDITRLTDTHMTLNKVRDNHNSRKTMEWGYTFYTNKGRKRFIKKDDLDNFLNKKSKAYQEYSRWRIKQHGQIRTENHEFYNYYLPWLREKDE